MMLALLVCAIIVIIVQHDKIRGLKIARDAWQQEYFNVTRENRG